MPDRSELVLPVQPGSAAESPGGGVAGVLAAIGLAASDAQVGQLQRHLSLLQRWNQVYNLTSIRDPDQMLVQHFADCLAVLPFLRRVTQGRAVRVLDVGSGGGLPGAVFAVMQPDWHVSCIDTVGKKASFIRQVASESGLANLVAVHGRVEAVRLQPFDLIVSRAFSSLADFVGLTEPLLAADGVWAALKGKRPDEEMAALPSCADVFHVEQIQVPGLQAQRCVVLMRRPPPPGVAPD